MPKCKRSGKPIIVDDQMAQLIPMIADDRDRLILVLVYHYGRCAEEVFGLTWDCVDEHHRIFTTSRGTARCTGTALRVRHGAPAAHRTEGNDSRLATAVGRGSENTRVPLARTAFQIMRRSFSTDDLARDPKATQAIIGHAKLDIDANVYAQSQRSKIAELLDTRWLRLGLSPTKTVQ